MRKYRILELVITRDQTRNALHAPSRSLQESPQEGTAGTEPKCSHDEKLSRLGECPCLQRRGTRVNSCPGTSKISCEQHYSFTKEPRQFFPVTIACPRHNAVPGSCEQGLIHFLCFIVYLSVYIVC